MLFGLRIIRMTIVGMNYVISTDCMLWQKRISNLTGWAMRIRRLEKIRIGKQRTWNVTNVMFDVILIIRLLLFGRWVTKQVKGPIFRLYIIGSVLLIPRV